MRYLIRLLNAHYVMYRRYGKGRHSIHSAIYHSIVDTLRTMGIISERVWTAKTIQRYL